MSQTTPEPVKPARDYMNGADRDRLRAHIAEWVKGQKERWKEHASDLFLASILETLVVLEHKPHRCMENVAYQAACRVFEVGMEHACGVRTNGHHIAQSFGTHFKDYIWIEQAPGDRCGCGTLKPHCPDHH